jgi:hypothetical protein
MDNVFNIEPKNQNSMERLYLASLFIVCFLAGSDGTEAQTTRTQPTQLELLKPFIGTWQTNIGKDTVEIWDCQPYGEGFIINVSRLTQGQKTPYYINNVGFDPGDGKLKGYVLWPSGDYMTWIASYLPEKKFKADLVINFNPEAVWTRYEMVYVSPKDRIWINYNLAGEKTAEFKFIKIK